MPASPSASASIGRPSIAPKRGRTEEVVKEAVANSKRERERERERERALSLIHISEPTRLALI
eukprot:11815518-Alexandrium_andersonii.AAC.1